MKIKWMMPVIGVMGIFSGLAWGEDGQVSGLASLGLRGVDETRNSAKFQEYRDLDDGVFGNILLNGYQSGYYVDVTGKNIGLDDQSYLLKGGKYGSFKYSLFYNEIPHNYSFGAKSIYPAGIGSANLTYSAAPSTDPATWNEIDYKSMRKEYGAGLEVSLNTPFYLQAKVSQLEWNGTQPFSGDSSLTNTSGAIVDLPMPLDYKSKTLYLESGYRTKNIVFSVDGTLNSFENDNDYLRWMTPGATSVANPQTTSLAPDSKYWKIGGQMMVRLPLNSALSARGSFSRNENSLDLLPNVASLSNFDGDIRYTTASVAFTTNPIKNLDVKAYYNYLDKDNNSDKFTNFQTPTGGGTTPTEVYYYNKQSTGIDAGVKLPLSSKLSTGYEYLQVSRNSDIRPDAKETIDNKVYVQLKNSYFDMVTAKVRYSRLMRDGSFEATGVNVYNRLFDAADKNQDSVKVEFEVTPIHNMEIGLQYAYKTNDYRSTNYLGVTDDSRQEFIADLAYDVPGLAKFSSYFDYETSKTKSSHRRASPGNENPSVFIGNNGYNWTQKIKNDNYAFGVAALVPVIKDKLDFQVSYDYQDADAGVDFSNVQFGTPVNVNNYDDYTKQAIGAKAMYKFNKNLLFSLGYAYEKYEYSDYSLDNYQYVPAGATTHYLSGAYSDHNYETSIVYMTAAYKF